MTEATLKQMLQNIVNEAVQKTKANFDACPQEMDAMEAMEKVLNANFDADFHTRLFRTARMYGIPDMGADGIRAYVKAVSMPADKGKHLAVALEVENCLDNRMSIARLDGAAVNIYCSQLDVEAYADRGENENQEELDLDPDDDDNNEDLDGVAE